MRPFLFHDLDPAEKRLAQLADDIGYLILAEVTDRHHTEKLARVDFTPSDLLPYVDSGPDDPDEREDEEFPEAGELDEPEVPRPSLQALAGEPTPADLATAAYRWVREQAGANMNGLRRCKFKLSVWSPKGDKLLFSVRFSCEDPDWDDEEQEAGATERRPPPMMPAPGPAYAQRTPVRPGVGAPEAAAQPRDKVAEAMLMLDAIPEGRVWMALGGAVAHHLHMMQEGYDNLARHHATIMTTQNTQILRNQKVLEDLTAQVINMRTGFVQAEREERDDAAGARVREELGKTFIAELGGLGRAIAASKLGVSPELAELAEIVTASPELADAIKSPAVRQMLRDEKTRKELAQLLTLAAQAADAGAPANAQTPPAAEPPKDEPKAA